MATHEPRPVPHEVRLHHVVTEQEGIEVTVQIIAAEGGTLDEVVVHAALDVAADIEAQTSHAAMLYGLAREAGSRAVDGLGTVRRGTPGARSFAAVPQQVLAWARQAPNQELRVGD